MDTPRALSSQIARLAGTEVRALGAHQAIKFPTPTEREGAMPKQKKPTGFARTPATIKTQMDAATILFDIPEVVSVFAPQTGVISVSFEDGTTKEVFLGTDRDTITQGLYALKSLLDFNTPTREA